MAWQDETIVMLRLLIDDMSSTPTYTDKRLEQVLVVAAKFVTQEIDLSTDYTITINCPNVSPDPTVTATSDPTFVNFMVLKAACIIDTSSLRTAALVSGVKAKCGPAVIETLKRMDGFKTLIENGFCAAYEELKKQYGYGNVNLINAVLSPFTSPDFDPENYSHIDVDALGNDRMYRGF